MSSEPSQPPAPYRPGCDDARTGMRAFVAGTAAPNQPAPWREHMRACSRCTLEYHQLVQDVARLARGATDATGRATDAYARSGPEERARRSLIAADPRRSWRLPKLFLPVALLGLLGIVLTRPGVTRPMLRAVTGTVLHADAVVDGAEPVAVARGDACSTTSGARAQLELGESRIVFEPESSFLVDRTDRLAVRFFAGEARIEGDAQLLLPTCAIEVRAGMARIVLAAGQVLIQCDEGSVTRTEAGGRYVIFPGESTSLVYDAAVGNAVADEPPSAGGMPGMGAVGADVER